MWQCKINLVFVNIFFVIWFVWMMRGLSTIQNRLANVYNKFGHSFGHTGRYSTDAKVLLKWWILSIKNCKSNFHFIYYAYLQPINWPKKFISGVQPTGVLHIGNYFGAIQRWVQLQEQGKNVTFFIADLHSMTMPYVNYTALITIKVYRMTKF